MPWDSSRTPGQVGAAIHDRMVELFPLCRSISGDGLRQTLRLLSGEPRVEIVETPSGSTVFDWIVPPEWNIREAWIQGPDGTRILDFANSNLHVLNYSTPIDAHVTLEELRKHIYTQQADPTLIPYRTSYYEERWGFCMSATQLDSLQAGNYHVVIDSTLSDGSVSYGEAVIPGATDDVVLLTTYACHPSLANDNLSGVALLAEIGKALAAQSRLRFTYRLVWAPGTIGPLCWLANNRALVERIKHGLVVSCVGDSGPFTYKRSRQGNTEIDRVTEYVLASGGDPHRVVDWSPYGGDERQYCSPGFDLPVGAFSRTPANEFREYHSSADDLDFVRPEHLGASFAKLLDVIDVIESNETLVNMSRYGEPQLGRRGLYRGVGGGSSEELALLWVLSLSDGSASLLDIAQRAELPFARIRDAADTLAEHGLVTRVTV